MASVIVVDASVLIAHFDAGDAHHERAETLLLAVADEPLAASPLTLAEVLVGPARAGRLDAATAALRQLMCGRWVWTTTPRPALRRSEPGPG